MKHFGHRTTGWKAGRFALGVSMLAAVIGIAVVAEAQQQATDTSAAGQQQDDLFGPPTTGQDDQLDQGLDPEAAQPSTLQSQPPTGLEDQRSGQAGALNQRRAQEATRQPAGQGRRGALYEQSALGDQPMPPPRDRRDDMRQDMQREMRGQQRMGQAGERGELGVFLMPSEGPGAEIRGVVTGSAADEAGLEAGDVILEINGEGVTSPEEISQAVREIGAGQQAMLQVWRDGEQHEVAATLRPAQDRYAVGFRGDEAMEMGGNLEERQRRLEQQLDRVMQELQQLRQEMGQMRGTGGEAGAMPPADIDRGAAPSGFEPMPPDALDEPTGVNEPFEFDDTGAGAASPRPSGTVSGAAGTTPVEAGSTSGPGVPPASTP